MDRENLLKSALKDRLSRVGFSRNSIVDNYRAGVAGAVMFGCGLTAETIGIVAEQPIDNFIGIAPLVIGALLVKDSFEDIKTRTEWLIQDQSDAIRIETELQASAE